MSDLMDKLGKKQASEGATKVAPGTSDSTVNINVNRGDNLLNQTSTNISDSTNTAKSNQTSADNISASSKVEPSGTETIVDDPDSWTKESSLKEVKKLRDENKTYRVKYQEQVERLKQDAEARIAAKEQEMASLAQAAKELEKIKQEQEDKKRSLEEKLSHRESKLTETQTLMQIREQEYQKRLQDAEAVANSYKAREQAEKEIYVQRINEEISKIPEKYKEIAGMLVKGAGDDPRDGLLAINEARLKGVFEDKTVVVNHSVPGAGDGARSSKEKLEVIAREEKNKMSSGQKIKSALDSLKSGQPNSAFRTK